MSTSVLTRWQFVKNMNYTDYFLVLATYELVHWFEKQIVKYIFRNETVLFIIVIINVIVVNIIIDIVIMLVVVNSIVIVIMKCI